MFIQYLGLSRSTLPCSRLKQLCDVMQFANGSIGVEQGHHRIICLNKNCHERAINHDVLLKIQTIASTFKMARARPRKPKKRALGIRCK